MTNLTKHTRTYKWNGLPAYVFFSTYGEGGVIHNKMYPIQEHEHFVLYRQNYWILEGKNAVVFVQPTVVPLEKVKIIIRRALIEIGVINDISE